MSNKKQTATSWLIQKLTNRQNGIFDGLPHLSLDEIYAQAEQMHKEQIMNCCMQTTQDCYIAVMGYLNKPLKFTDEDLNNQKLEAEQFYQQTYGE